MNSQDAWRKGTDWLLTRFTRPVLLSRRRALSVVLSVLAFIGLADYASGIRISLVVFYFVPILLSVAWFGWRVAVAVVCASIVIRGAGDYVASGYAPIEFWSWWNWSSSVIVFLFVVWLFHNLLAMHRRLESRVADRTEQLLEAVEHRRRLEHELVTVSSNERNRMGQELHDDICQHLVGTTLAAKVLAQRLSKQDNALAAEAQAIVGLIEEGTGRTRQLARGLLLSEIAPEELPEKLSELADEGSRSGVPCRFLHAGSIQVADAGVAAQLYRIAQEAMRNAIRHADARQVEISLVGDPQAICLMVEDDGRGLPGTDASSGMGLPIMSHRAAYIGAVLSFVPIVGRGTRVVCHLPVGATVA